MEWPDNWREKLDKMRSCDRCGNKLMPKIYCLSERFPNILVCYDCSMAYHDHVKKFANDILKNKGCRQV